MSFEWKQALQSLVDAYECTDGKTINSYNDVVLIIYAEGLLNYAEAKIESIQIDQSVYDAINQVRQRAVMSGPVYGIRLNVFLTPHM